MPTSGTRAQQVCTGLTPDQWKAMPEQWPSPYVAGTTSGTVVKSLTDVNATSTDLQSTTTTKSTTTQRRQPSGTTSTGTTGTTGTTTTDPTATNTSDDGTLYHCPVTGFGGRVFGQRTMMNVLGMTDGGSNVYSLGRYMVAALLNACSGRTPVLGEDGVRDMWNDLVNRGYYEPTAGVRWDAADIVAYLRTTMG